MSGLAALPSAMFLKIFRLVLKISIQFFCLSFWVFFSDSFKKGIFREMIHTTILKCYVFDANVKGTDILSKVGRSG